MGFRCRTASIFYHYEVKNGYFSLLYALSSPSWPWLFYSTAERLHLVALKKLRHLCPIFFATIPYRSMFSFGLLAFPILELKSPTTSNTTSPYLLHFCTSIALSPNFLCTSFALLFDSESMQYTAPYILLWITFERQMAQEHGRRIRCFGGQEKRTQNTTHAPINERPHHGNAVCLAAAMNRGHTPSPTPKNLAPTR